MKQFKRDTIKQDKDEHFVMIKGTIYQEIVRVKNISETSNISS